MAPISGARGAPAFRRCAGLTRQAGRPSPVARAGYRPADRDRRRPSGDPVTPILLALAAVAASPAPGSPQARYISCANDAKANPQMAAVAAQEWIDKGGGTSARQCLGLAQAALERWPQAAEAFEAGAVEAERTRDPRRGEIRAAAGSAWLAAGDAARARAQLDSALASGLLDPSAEGDARIERARAEVALADLAAARA